MLGIGTGISMNMVMDLGSINCGEFGYVNIC